MKVKKFNCHKCGAPKVNPYEGVYVICDYCNTIVDIDYTSSAQIVGTNLLNPEKQTKWDAFYTEYISKGPQYKASGDKAKYRQLQYDYCKEYFAAFPQSLPPNVPNGEVLEQYCQASADFMSEQAFDPTMQKAHEKYQNLYIKLEYYTVEGKTKVVYEKFDAMMEAYMEMLEIEMKILYGNPAYELFKEYYPEEFNRKQRISQIAQMWIPYLAEPHADNFLNKYKLKHEYVDINPPLITTTDCESCKTALKVPKGAITVVCKHCRHQNTLYTTVNCQSCGVENPLPHKWKVMIDCNSCGTELRIVQPLFG